MPENEQQDKTLSEILVKEAVGKGMDSPMRDSILEAVEEADGSTPGGKRSLPLAGALFGAGAVLGFLAGRESPDLEETPLEGVQEPDIIEDVIEETTSDDAETTETESESETADDGGSSRLSRVLLAVGLLAGVAVLRRRLAGGEEEEWEPIEEFEPATGDEFDVGADDESEAEEAEAETDESDETEEE